jgi:excisionase family DNA binding protein
MAAKAQERIIVSPVGQVYTTAQVATILQVHRRTIERLIAQGQMQAIHVGRRLRVTAQQLQAFLTHQDTTDQPASSPPGEDFSP